MLVQYIENRQAVYLRLCNPMKPMYRKRERYNAYFWRFWDAGSSKVGAAAIWMTVPPLSDRVFRATRRIYEVAAI